jgi:hypothetical protein
VRSTRSSISTSHLPRAEPDVYDLDVASWLELLAQAGARDVSHTYTDQWKLFVQYVFR